jgi:sigma-B regulation protein RsbQ
MSVIKRNNVKILGQGTQPLMFSHGYGCDQNMWRLVVPAFENDYKVILFDHVGAGHSDLQAFDKAKYRSLGGYAEDVLEICHELDLRGVSFVGHSVSSMIGVLAAIREPERFSNLILVGPSPRYVNDDGYVGGFRKEEIDGLLEMLDANYLGWASTMAPAIMGNSQRPELATELRNSFCRTDPEIAKFFAKVTFLSDNRGDLSKVCTRTLVLQCSDDVIAPTAVGEYVHRQIAGSELKVMQATGHCPNLSAPEETVALIRDFLGRSAVSAPTRAAS